MSYYHSSDKSRDYSSSKKYYKKCDEFYYKDSKDKHCCGCNQIVNVNVNNGHGGTDPDNGNTTTILSAFRAVNTTETRLAPGVRTKIFYPVVEYDLANEYNAATSIFIPKVKGIYSLIATLSTIRDEGDSSEYVLSLEIQVNGNVVAIANNYKGPIPAGNQVIVTTDIQLQANDKVEVFAQSGHSVTTLPNGPVASAAFSATRLPSPN